MTFSSSDGNLMPTWMSGLEDEEVDTIQEEERTWRDPSAHKFRVAVAGWLRSGAAHNSIIKASIS